MAELRLSPDQIDIVRGILWAHLPGGARVRVFGSRATGRGFKPHSDLDLLIDSPVEVPLIAWANLREALAESDLPFSVDLLDRTDISAEFLSALEIGGMVELQSLPAKTRVSAHANGQPPRSRAVAVVQHGAFRVRWRFVTDAPAWPERLPGPSWRRSPAAVSG